VGHSREESVELLRSVGLRVTATRLAVLDALARRSHADTDTVIGEVKKVLGAVSSQAVYNVLAAFVDAGIARRIEPAGSAALYELRVADNHHHVVCRRCGAVQDVDCARGRRPCLTPSDTHGYLLDEAEVTYWGICPTCQATSSAASPTAGTSPRARISSKAGNSPRTGTTSRTGTTPRAGTGPNAPRIPRTGTIPSVPDRPGRGMPVRRKTTFDPRTTPTREEDRRVRE